MKNEFKIYFKRSTNGFQALCRIERRPIFSTPHFGILRKGREMTKNEAIRYSTAYIKYRQQRQTQFVYTIDKSNLTMAINSGLESSAIIDEATETD